MDRTNADTEMEDFDIFMASTSGDYFPFYISSKHSIRLNVPVPVCWEGFQCRNHSALKRFIIPSMAAEHPGT
jgi:hypothetical protein